MTPPEQRMDERMDDRLARDRLGPTEVRALAEALAARHALVLAQPDRAPQPDFFRASLDACARRTAPPAHLRRRFEDALEAQADRLLARAGRGRILANAAELRPSDVVFAADGAVHVAPAVGREIGVPFDAALEIASLSLALASQARADLAERLVSAYANAAEDFDLYPVLDLFESFCALRADVARVPSQAERTPLARPLVIATSGPVASGKSTLARALADRLAAPLAVADRIRDHLVHGAPGRPLHEAGWAHGFEPGFGPRVYAEMLRRGDTVLASGRPIVLDACFATPAERAGARALARRHRVPFLLVQCRVDEDVQRARLAERDRADAADGDWSQIASQLAEREVEPTDVAEAERVEVDTGRGPERALEELLERGLAEQVALARPGARA